MADKTNLIIIFLLVIPLILGGSLVIMVNSQQSESELFQITEEPIVPSNPTNVVIRETAKYNAPIGNDEPIAFYTGVIYWEELAGATLSFFVNTTKVIEAEFKDFETKEPLTISDNCGSSTACVRPFEDRYRITPEGRSFQYVIESYYEPDIVEDTGFIVVFNSQSVDFSLQIDGEDAFARTDYYNKITLPQGAGAVSWAPQDDGFLGIGLDDEGRYFFEWEYVNRQMDTKHDPLMISVTYNYDPIYLAFTEQVYQNQQEQQKRQDEINRLNLIQQSFAVISSLAVILSLFSIFFAYLLARRKFENELQRAKELPKREASDIENSPPLKVPVRSMFLSAIIIIPLLFNPVMMADGLTLDQNIDDDIVLWEGVYDLRADFTLTEYISMKLPVEKPVVYIYADTENSELKVYDSFDNPIPFDVEDNRYAISNPGLEFRYELDRDYEVANNSNMLVWLDRFWLEFTKPDSTQFDEDPYFNVDMTYTVILPPNANLYSASPSDLLEVTKVENRYRVQFTDTNRQMDAFHDVFETQVTFSFISIYEALEDLDSDFVQVRAEQQSLESLVRVAAQEVLIFAILGIIAPLISFLIAYWVFRRRYKKMIDRAEKEQEEQIFIESPQIEALVAATGETASQRVTDAYLGHYYRAVEFLSRELEMDVSRLNESQLLEIIRKKDYTIDTQLLMEVFNMGRAINPEDSVGFDQLNEIARLVEEMISSTTEEDF